ncbi:putative ATP-dependent RNA helicase [uncultured archaeon]|nr:putative ATP-dependent RNA helicase [uncultured archaeon]
MDLKGIPLDARLVKAIEGLGYEEFTPIQVSAIPEVQKGRDVIAQSSTGSGKTAAFGLPILEKIKEGAGIQAMILTPTRELCQQVSDSLSDFAGHTKIRVAPVFGGVSINPQKQALQYSEVVVGTPGRILDHIGQGSIKLGKVRFFVLDEADRMCDMGFYEDIERIMQALPKERQTMLFSATITRDVDKLVSQYMKNPANVTGEQYVDPSLLKQVYYDVSPAEKFSVLMHLLKKNTFGLSLIFCSTRREVDVVCRNLHKAGLQAMAIHGGLTQSRRMHALDSLKKERIDTLVATDVAARGLDISGVSYVYNWDVPPTPEEYIHRIGRTARAGKDGLAITLLVPHDHLNFRSVMRNSSLTIVNEPTPEAEPVQMQRHSAIRNEGHGGAGPVGSGRGFGSGFGHSRGPTGQSGGRGFGSGRPGRGFGGRGSSGEFGDRRSGGHSSGYGNERSGSGESGYGAGRGTGSRPYPSSGRRSGPRDEGHGGFRRPSGRGFGSRGGRNDFPARRGGPHTRHHGRVRGNPDEQY